MKILIAGGTGMLGDALSTHLLKDGHEVVILSRRAHSSAAGIEFATWDPAKGELDQELVNSCDAIINLAGAPIAQRWTAKARKQIIRSRVDSSRLLSKAALNSAGAIKVLINASAMGFYEAGNEWRTESDPPGNHFMAEVCKAWEDAVEIPEGSSVRKVLIRISVVLGKGGALKAMEIPFKFGLGAPIGSGKQYMSVIHVDDLCRMFLFALKNSSLNGVYNAALPECPTNKAFSRSLARAVRRPFFLPAVPAFLLRLAVGEMAESVLMSFRISSEKIAKAGFLFEFPSVDQALNDIYRRH